MDTRPHESGAAQSAPANNHHIPPDRLRAEIEIQRPAPIERACAKCGTAFQPPRSAPDATLCRICYSERKRALDTLPETARGHWPEILVHFGIDREHLRDHHGPCPGCGGTDRFRYDDKDGRGSWVCGHGGDTLAGDGFKLLEHVYGWSAGESFLKVAAYFGIDDPSDLPPPDPVLTAKREAEAERARAQEQEQQQQTARHAAQIWEAAETITAESVNPYLSRKGVTVTENLRQIEVEAVAKIVGYHPTATKDGTRQRLQGVLLAVPYRRDGELTTVELIDAAGCKAALKGRGTKRGAFWLARPVAEDDHTIIIAEGVATALSILEATGYAVAASGSVGNMHLTAAQMKAAHPQTTVILAADLVKRTSPTDPVEPIEAAVKAARKFRPALPLIFPEVGPLAPVEVTDFNDLRLTAGLEMVRNLIEQSAKRAMEHIKPQPKKSKEKVNPSVPSDPSATGLSSFRNPSAILPESFRGALIFETDKTKKRLIDSHAATAVAEHLRGKVAWDAEAGAWMIWNQTHWEPLVVSAKAEKLIADAVDEGCDPIGYRVAYLAGITSIITRRNLLAAPECPVGVVPFENGLLDLETRKLTPATPDRALDWCLPWRWDSQADCPTIKAWLRRSVNGHDGETVELLRAWLAALVRGLELQYFLTLIGRGGSGKGTFQHLAAAVIGIRNVAVTDLARLETNRFETAKLYGKRLVMVNEAGKYGGSVDVLKAVTGRDHIPLERKHQQQSGSFRFRGLVLMATNEPIIATDSTSGLERRRITVRFPYSATPEEKADWDARGGAEAVLHPEIPGLIRWLLDMPVAEIKRRLSSPPLHVATENMLGMMAGNSAAEWLIEHCVPVADDTQGVQIGVKSSSAEFCLYPSYVRWCEETGRNHPVSLRKFSDTVIDIAEHMGHSVTKDRHKETRAYCLFGLRLRGQTEDPHDWASVRKDCSGNPEGCGRIDGRVEGAFRKDGRMEGKTLLQKNAEPSNTRARTPRTGTDKESF